MNHHRHEQGKWLAPGGASPRSLVQPEARRRQRRAQAGHSFVLMKKRVYSPDGLD